MIQRRELIKGLVSFMAAPAIVRVSSLMPIKSYKNYDDVFLELAHPFHSELYINEYYKCMMDQVGNIIIKLIPEIYNDTARIS